jgi:alpha-1,3-rhamnosyl/mannosyltransferase
MTRLVAAPARVAPAGTRVVLDVRPLQEPERTPITAEYLGNLLEAYTADPLPGESFVVVSRALRPDPTLELEGRGLPVHARRRLPPTSAVLRSAGLTLDSFLLRGAELGVSDEDGEPAPADEAREVDEAGDAGGPFRRQAGSHPRGTIYHTAGGAVPLASQLPVVATLLDLAPWELPDTYAASAAARFGHRLRARILHDAARVIVCSRATAESARRKLHLPAEKMCVVPLAVDEAFRAAGRDEARLAALRDRLGMPARYLVFSGRYDARKDLGTLFRALGRLRQEFAHDAEGPPTVALAIKYELDEDRAAVQRAVARSGVPQMLHVVPALSREDRAALVGGALALVYPSLSEATGLSALEALGVGVPVICSRAGALPEIVGSAGIVVEPQDPARLAAALSALWAGGPLSEQLRNQAQKRSESMTRTWRDVARETREVYAAAAATARSARAR